MKNKASEPGSSKADGNLVSAKISRCLRSLSKRKVVDKENAKTTQKETVKSNDKMPSSHTAKGNKETNVMESRCLRPRRALAESTNSKAPKQNAAKKSDSKETGEQNPSSKHVPIYKRFSDKVKEANCLKSDNSDIYDVVSGEDDVDIPKPKKKREGNKVKQNKAKKKATKKPLNKLRLAEVQAMPPNLDLLLPRMGFPANSPLFHEPEAFRCVNNMRSGSLPPLEDLVNNHLFVNFGPVDFVTSTPDKCPTKVDENKTAKENIKKAAKDLTLYHSMDDSSLDSFVSAREPPQPDDPYALFDEDTPPSPKPALDLDIAEEEDLVTKPKLDYSKTFRIKKKKPAAKKNKKENAEYEAWADKMENHFREIQDFVLMME